MMKKLILLGAACAAVFASCAKTEPVDGPATGKIRFTIDADAGLKSRALLSETSPLAITDMSVHVFTDAGIYIKTIDASAEWDATETSNVSQVADADELAAGSYYFLAVGADRTLTPPGAGTNLTAYTETVASATAISEIFSGLSALETIAADTDHNVPITINRVVAGVLLYLTDIPAMIGTTEVAGVRLVASTANSTVNLSSGAGSVPFASLPVTLIDIPLSGAVGGIFPSNDAATEQLDNSQLAGAFAFAATGVGLTVELYDTDGNAIPAGTWVVEDESGSTSINLAANTLFSLGQKYDDDSTDGEDGVPGTGDDDKGIDIGTLLDDEFDQTITITVNAEWGDINLMNLVPNP